MRCQSMKDQTSALGFHGVSCAILVVSNPTALRNHGTIFSTPCDLLLSPGTLCSQRSDSVQRIKVKIKSAATAEFRSDANIAESGFHNAVRLHPNQEARSKDKMSRDVRSLLSGDDLTQIMNTAMMEFALENRVESAAVSAICGPFGYLIGKGDDSARAIELMLNALRMLECWTGVFNNKTPKPLTLNPKLTQNPKPQTLNPKPHEPASRKASSSSRLCPMIGRIQKSEVASARAIRTTS